MSVPILDIPLKVFLWHAMRTLSGKVMADKAERGRDLLATKCIGSRDADSCFAFDFASCFQGGRCLRKYEASDDGNFLHDCSADYGGGWHGCVAQSSEAIAAARSIS